MNCIERVARVGIPTSAAVCLLVLTTVSTPTRNHLRLVPSSMVETVAIALEDGSHAVTQTLH